MINEDRGQLYVFRSLLPLLTTTTRPFSKGCNASENLKQASKENLF